MCSLCRSRPACTLRCNCLFGWPPACLTGPCPSAWRGLVRCVDQVGGLYVVQVTAWFASNATNTNTAQVFVRVVSAGVTAVIAGGDRSVGVLNTWQLDASGSIDRDNITTSAFSYNWTCATVTTSLATGVAIQTVTPSCVAADGSTVTLQSAATITFAAAALPAGVYQFTVTAAKGTVGALVPLHYRSASASVTVTVVDGSPPTVTPLVSSITTIPGSRVTLNCTVVPAPGDTRVPALLWTTASLSASTFANITLSPTRTLNFLGLLMSSTMSPGDYTFTLTATVGTVSAATSVVVTIAAPPRNGFVSATPATGTTLVTPFAVTTNGWTGSTSVSSPVHVV